MVLSPLAFFSRRILRKSLFNQPPNPQTAASKRNLRITRYTPAEYLKGRKKSHEVNTKLIPREEHKIEWGGLRINYIDTHTHLHSTLQMMKDAFHDGTIPTTRIDRFVDYFLPKQCTAVVDVLGNLDNLALYSSAVNQPWEEGFKYYFAVGAHPYNAADYTDKTHHTMSSIMEHPRCVAWGECGLDYFHTDTAEWPTQRQTFIKQLGGAVSRKKPILVTTRDAEKDTFSILYDHVPADHKIHMQSFTGSRELALKILDRWPNSTLGITGVITYSGTKHLAAMIEEGKIPLQRIMLGSKSPFVVPKNIYSYILKTTRPKLKTEKFAGSNSGMLPVIATFVAERVNKIVRKEPLETKEEMNSILKASNENAERFFGIKM